MGWSSAKTLETDIILETQAYNIQPPAAFPWASYVASVYNCPHGCLW